MTAQSDSQPAGHMQNHPGHTENSRFQEPLSRKEREKRVRQGEILKAARELFLSKGFRETTLEEIAHQAEFGKGTIYNYFASKEELFFGIIEQVIEEMQGIARESVVAPGSAREKLLLYAREIIRYVKDNGELLHVVYHELHRSNAPENVARLREILARGRGAWEVLAEPLKREIHDRTLRDFDALQMIVLFDSMLRGYCFHQFVIQGRPADEDYSAAAEIITSVFFDGIAERKDRG